MSHSPMSASRRPAPRPTGRTPQGSPARGPSNASGAAKKARLTGRAAILAVVMCAIALSLAYPVREYIAQRREIARLRAQERTAQQQVGALAKQKQRLGDPHYIKSEARRRLHMCMPTEKCYVVLHGGGGNGQATRRGGAPQAPPWYVTLWRSVDAAGNRP